MQEIIKAFLKRNNISENAGFIIAVSGGADSMTLLHAFRYLNYKILALHCNFNLRGKESDMDEQFVKRFCDTYGIKLSVKQFQTKEYAEAEGISIEMAARELRYEWFQEMKLKSHMDYIVVAHQSDDVAETILINLCRGTGIRGLSGIKPVNGDILRPLLACSREDILGYLEENELGYRTDSTNNSLDYLRNKIRHKIIPVLKEINPSFLATMQGNCNNLRETEALYLYAIKQLKNEVIQEENGELLINIRKTMATPAPSTLLHEILSPLGFNRTQVRDILYSANTDPGKQFSTDKYILTKGREFWRLFEKTSQTFTDMTIEAPGSYLIHQKKWHFDIISKTDDFLIPDNRNTACLDADKIIFPLTVRNWKEGDRFCPIGMKKLQKKLSDFFTDQKFTQKQKNECLLLTSEDKIAWIMDYRLDDRFKITSLTRNILIIYSE